MGKLRVGLLFGGRSVEHEVSIVSATSIHRALDPAKYDVTLIGIDPDGHWRIGSGAAALPETVTRGDEVRLPALPSGGRLVPGPGSAAQSPGPLDVILPIVHGRGGEDGCLQGLFELAEIPYVGSGVLSSALQMDKDVAKRLLAAAGLPVVPDVVLRGVDLEPANRRSVVAAAIEKLGLPLFVKPANSGSSVGISKAVDEATLTAAIDHAARFDTKVVVERSIDAREVEVAVLGNEHPEASLPGEIRPTHEFYDYDAKYLDDTTELIVPAPLSEELSKKLRALALEAFHVLEGEGLARVDFFVERGTDAIYVNELNSLPGFTEGSMFPRLWAASGLPYPALLDRMIELAIARHERRARLETRYLPGGTPGDAP